MKICHYLNFYLLKPSNKNFFQYAMYAPSILEGSAKMRKWLENLSTNGEGPGVRGGWGFCALGCRLAALCRPAGVIWVVGREIGNFVPWGGV